MFMPLKKHGAFNGGLKVGIVGELNKNITIFICSKYFRNYSLLLGFGGIGQMGVLLAKKMGNHVTVISSSNKKEALAKEIGADNYVVSKDPESMSANAGSLNLIIDTIPAAHDINPYLSLLKKKGTMNIIGAFPEPFQVRIG